MANVTEAELKQIAKLYLDSNKIAVNNFNVTKDNIIGAVDKIGKMEMIDSTFYDKLTELDGDNLPLGKTIEEYYQDLIKPVDWDRDVDGSKAKRFWSPTYRPVAYSYSLGRKVIPLSIPNGDIDRAVNSTEQSATIIAKMTKRVSDSKAVYKYALKRGMIGKLIEKVKQAYTNSATYTNATTDIVEGNTYKDSTGAYAICVESKTHASGDTWQSLINGGYLVPMQMQQTIAKPVDTATGEAFLVALKEAAENAQDVSEGFSFNGNTIGAEYGVTLYVKQGVMPTVQVQTLAGAINKEALNVDVKIKVIKDFGANSGSTYAVLVDERGLKLHNDYDAMREDSNGFGDFVSLFDHTEYTAFISRNTFVKIFNAQE